MPLLLSAEPERGSFTSIPFAPMNGDFDSISQNPNLNPGAPFPRVRLPESYVVRPDALNAVKEKLLAEDERTLVVSAISGLGGLGKSVLATALVLDEEVQARFKDGILWVTLGQNPDLQTMLGGWVRQLDRSGRRLAPIRWRRRRGIWAAC